jgi:hypothetical protein
MIDIWLLIQHLYGAPIFPGERQHDSALVTGVFHYKAQCNAGRARFESNAASGPSGYKFTYECRRISLGMDDFESDAKFAPCSHLQPSDISMTEIKPTESIDRTCGRTVRP